MLHLLWFSILKNTNIVRTDYNGNNIANFFEKFVRFNHAIIEKQKTNTIHPIDFRGLYWSFSNVSFIWVTSYKTVYMKISELKGIKLVLLKGLYGILFFFYYVTYKRFKT